MVQPINNNLAKVQADIITHEDSIKDCKLVKTSLKIKLIIFNLCGICMLPGYVILNIFGITAFNSGLDLNSKIITNIQSKISSLKINKERIKNELVELRAVEKKEKEISLAFAKVMIKNEQLGRDPFPKELLGIIGDYHLAQSLRQSKNISDKE